MGKIITTPLSMITAFSNVGDVQWIGGRIYDFTNIRLSKIRNIVQGNWTVGSVCSSNNINFWSPFKPYKRGTHQGEHHGMIVQNGQLIYNKPLAVNGYHLGDFAGYKHNAVQPYFNPPILNSAFHNNISHSVYFGRNKSNYAISSLIIIPPEFDVRTIQNTSIDRVTIKTLYPSFPARNRHMTTFLYDSHMSNRRIDARFQYFQNTQGNHSFNLEIWFGHGSDLEVVQMPGLTWTSMNAIDTNITVTGIVYFKNTGIPNAFFNGSLTRTGLNWTYSNVQIFDNNFNEITGSHYLRAKRITDPNGLEWVDLGTRLFQFGGTNITFALPASWYTYNSVSDTYTLNDNVELELNNTAGHLLL